MVTLLQRVYIMLYQTDFTKALFDFKVTCSITVHVNSTDTEEKFMKLTLGYIFFVDNFKNDFGSNLTNVLVAVDRPQMDGHVLRTRLIFFTS